MTEHFVSRGADHPTRRGIKGIVTVPAQPGRLEHYDIVPIPLDDAAKQYAALTGELREASERQDRANAELAAAKVAAGLAHQRQSYAATVLDVSAEGYAADAGELRPGMGDE